MNTRRIKRSVPSRKKRTYSSSDDEYSASTYSGSTSESSSSPYSLNNIDQSDFDVSEDDYEQILDYTESNSFEDICDLARNQDEDRLDYAIREKGKCVNVTEAFYSPVSKILHEGGDYQLLEKHGASLAMIARGVGLKGDAEEADHLLMEGANINELLCGAILGKHYDLMRHLLAQDADPLLAIKMLTFTNQLDACEYVENHFAQHLPENEKLLMKLSGAALAGDKRSIEKILPTIIKDDKEQAYCQLAHGYGFNRVPFKQLLRKLPNLQAINKERILAEYIDGLAKIGAAKLIHDTIFQESSLQDAALFCLAKYGQLGNLMKIFKSKHPLYMSDSVLAEGFAAGYELNQIESMIDKAKNNPWCGRIGNKEMLAKEVVSNLFKYNHLNDKTETCIVRFLSQINGAKNRKILAEQITAFQLKDVRDKHQISATKKQMKHLLKLAEKIYPLMQQGYKFRQAHALINFPELKSCLPHSRKKSSLSFFANDVTDKDINQKVFIDHARKIDQANLSEQDMIDIYEKSILKPNKVSTSSKQAIRLNKK